jgi:predicted Zn-ribbon and HTH transcriptional regulator
MPNVTGNKKKKKQGDAKKSASERYGASPVHSKAPSRPDFHPGPPAQWIADLMAATSETIGRWGESDLKPLYRDIYAWIVMHPPSEADKEALTTGDVLSDKAHGYLKDLFQTHTTFSASDPRIRDVAASVAQVADAFDARVLSCSASTYDAAHDAFLGEGRWTGAVLLPHAFAYGVMKLRLPPLHKYSGQMWYTVSFDQWFSGPGIMNCESFASVVILRALRGRRHSESAMTVHNAHGVIRNGLVQERIALESTLASTAADALRAARAACSGCGVALTGDRVKECPKCKAGEGTEGRRHFFCTDTCFAATYKEHKKQHTSTS